MRLNRLMIALLLALTPAAMASTTWYVNGVSGNDSNDCKSPTSACKNIGHAISLASSGDAIRVAPATYYENITINASLKIVGSGAKRTIISGHGIGSVVTIQSAGIQVTLSRVTIQHGYTNGNGGGIYNAGTLTINESTIASNAAVDDKSTMGGGIYNGYKLTINNSTIEGNRVSVGNNPAFGTLHLGGGIYNAGTLLFNNSTLFDNAAEAHVTVYAKGGGIYNAGTAKISNGTIASNDAIPNGGGAEGGGIDGSATLQNSIVANNFAGWPYKSNCYGRMISDGYNLSSDTSCSFNAVGDLVDVDPVLGGLGYHGGPTETVPLLSGSPAIDAGNPDGCRNGQGHLLKTDQRGKPRPDPEDTGGCDMGAFERQKD